MKITDEMVETAAHAVAVEEKNRTGAPAWFKYDHARVALEAALAVAPELPSDVRERLERAEAALERVQELHGRRDDLMTPRGGRPVCDGCGDEEGWASEWPCLTITALEGKNDV